MSYITSENTFDLGQGSVKKATTGLSSADLWKVPRDRIIVVEGFNVREQNAAYKARVEALATSIETNGYMADKPISGYIGKDEAGNDVIFCTDGHTRLAAIDSLIERGVEIGEIPVVTKPRGTSMEDITIALFTSNTGEKLTPYETAIVCKRLVGYGMEPKEIAQRLGLTKVYVDQLLDLLAAPKAVREMVSSGKVSATLASQTLKKHGKGAAKVLAEGVKQAEAKGKSRVTAKHVEKAEKPAKTAKKAAVEPVTAEPSVTIVTTTLEQLLSWVTGRGLQEDLNVLALVAHIGTCSIEQVQQALAVPETAEDESL